ncbi:hypothetical protein FB567DRAFT_597585 [Paraphoma chrysanthemicola]|uniref:Uncharacterized protein n=1 Tax=Paraphoma chrysanthemicola TaxID=798071 RepID=A0A8K0VT72_9PLEO|nr:hypothetical protein FB567DRAFT_597585 [Paraphoma chrysanthemicola]
MAPLSPRGSPDDTTVLFLFISFAILIILALLLIVVSCQTWMLWKMAQAVVEQDARLIKYPGSRKRRSMLRQSVQMGRVDEEDGEEKESMMSGGLGVGDGESTKGFRWAGKEKKGLMGRWF